MERETEKRVRLTRAAQHCRKSQKNSPN